MKHWIHLIRPVNLILLAATMYFVDVFILQPNFTTYGIEFTLNEFQFFLLVLSVVLICAAGYVINDYFDVEIDGINKPEKQFIGKSVPAKKAFNLYLLLTFIGLAIGTYLSIIIDFWKLVTVYVIAIVLLYFYSAAFKRTVLLGNFIVSFLAALSVIIVLLFEPALYRLARPADYFIAGLVTNYILGIAVFAFTLTMVREVIKDMEDMDGDRRMSAKTIAVNWGIIPAKIIAIIFIFITASSLIYLLFFVLGIDNRIYYYYLGGLNLYLLYIIVKIISARSKNDYTQISKFLKITMLIGICIMPLYYLLEF